MKNIDLKYTTITLFFLIFLFASCQKEEFVDPIPQDKLSSSLFGACFERTLSNPADPLTEEISFPLAGDADDFEFFKMTSMLRNKNGIRSILVELNQMAYFKNFDSTMFQRGSNLIFKFNIGTTNDFVSGTPFSKRELEDFLQVGKVFNSTLNTLGTIEMEYRGHDKEDEGLLRKHYILGDEAPFLESNNVTIVDVEDFTDKDFDGNVITEGLKVDLEFKFTGTIRFPDLPYPYFNCELNNGKATVYIPYE